MLRKGDGKRLFIYNGFRIYFDQKDSQGKFRPEQISRALKVGFPFSDTKDADGGVRK